MRDFKLSDNFLADYRDQQPDWGFDGLGYVVYKRTYSRKKDDGTSEEFWETCQRVVEGVYSAQKRHCRALILPWNNDKAQRSAQEMFRRMWEFKFLPPGRSLWMGGTQFVEDKGSAALNNCAFRSSEDIKIDFADPFCWAMDMLMLGVGVGFDTKGAETFRVAAPREGTDIHQVTDDREGWVDLLRRVLTAYSGKGSLPKEIDYSLVRPPGSPILGFGGTASGHGPLDELISSVHDTLRPLIGEPITSSAIVDLFNLVGRCVVAGNVRRSAEIALGDPNDEEFLNLKNPSTRANKDALMHHRWASNNSVFAEVGMDYSKVAPLTAINGEPGYEWLDNARNYGRMIDPPDYKDTRVMGTNPCVTSDTWVNTSEGARQAWTLLGKQFTAIVNGKPYKSGPSGFWKTGEKEVFLVTTDKGYAFKATANHLIQVQQGKELVWTPVSDLSTEDLLVLSNNREWVEWGESSESDFAEGYLVGHVLGDGTLKKDKAVFSVWDEDGPGIKGMMDEVLKSINTLGITHRSDWKGWSPVVNRGEHRLNSAALGNWFLNHYGMDWKRKRPNLVTVERHSSKFYKGFLRGLFDTDGSVQGTQKKGVSVRLSQNDLELLHTVQRMLLRLGIVSKVYENRRAEGLRRLPDGKGGSKLYPCKALHELIISNDSIVEFSKKVGFSHNDKEAKLNELIASYVRTPNRDKFVSKVTSVVSTGVESVYDVEVSDVHAFSANGVIVHNCVEQSLESGELCNLVETFPGNHDSYEDYQKTLKYAYLYAKSVTLIPTHSELSNAIMMRNRRIGCSMSGIAQAMKKHGRREFLNWCDSGYQYLDELDGVYSEWLCIPKSIKKTSVKPSGSVSLLPGVTPGIHYPHSEYYLRRVRFQENHPLVEALRMCGYDIEQDKYSPNTVVVSFPVKEENYDRSKSDLTMWEQLENAAQMQAYWADNQVSVTVTFTKEEAKDIQYALELYETRLKGVSFLPASDHGYEQAPYEEITKEEYEAYRSRITPEQLPNMLASDTELHDTTDKFCSGDKCEIPIKN